MSAFISPCGRFRYTLERPLAPTPRNWLLWVMLNPSTADATVNDPLVAKCARDLYFIGKLKQHEIGRLFGISQNTVSRMVSGQTWGAPR